MNYFEVHAISKSFGGLKAVDRLHFDVKHNSITGLIGPNGAGKTTAFNLISHFLPRDEGAIDFHGKSLRNIPAYRVARRGLVRTFQQIRLLPNLTVRENLLLACSHEYDHWWKSFVPKDETEQIKKIKNLLHTVELEKFLDHQAGDLSYGQSKIVEILQKILTDADFILLDEPASGINPTRLKTIETLIRSLQNEGKTILIIEHNMPFIMNLCDEIIVMENGRFLMQDTPEKVQKDPRVLEAYLGKKENYN